MEFNLSKLKIHQIDDFWRVIMYVDGVKVRIAKPSLVECFECIHRNMNDQEFQKQFTKYKRDVGVIE